MTPVADTAENAGAGRFRLHRAGIVLVVAALCATLAVPLVLGGRNVLSSALDVPAQGYLVLFAMIATSWVARTLKLRMLLRQLGTRAGFGRMFLVSLATDFAFLATPGGIGGYAASLYYFRRSGASTSTAATVTAADQALDLVFFALALPLAGIFLLHSGLPPAVREWVTAAVALLLACTAAALVTRRRWIAWFAATDAFAMRHPRLQRYRQILRDFCVGLRADARVLIGGGPLFVCTVFGLTTLQWMTRYGVLWAALALLGHRVPFALTLSLQSVVLHAAQWSGIPSGGGGAELGLTAALAHWVAAADLATALLLWRMATLYIGLVAGALAAAALAWSRTEVKVTAVAESLATEQCAE